LKFAALDRLAQSLGCERVATGHYARVQFDERSGRYRLLRGRDRRKDQSYFLWELTQEQLARAIFPLGEMTKDEVRAAARRLGLTVAEKAESQEICFVPDGDYAGFIDRYLETEGRASPPAGEIVSTRGEVLGSHKGLHHYTVGQRRGLGIAHNRPLYVVAIDAARNRVIVGEDHELLAREFTAAGVNWVAFAEPREAVRAEVRVRYRHEEAPATIEMIGERRARIRFDEPQRAITPGQATVFYRGEEVLGGGWIVRVKRD
jgi:tRNA-specific 2-thiouridylase